MMIVERQNDGQWCVKDGDRVLLSDVSNAQAWRFVDVNTGQHVSRAEATTDWLMKRTLND